MNNQRKLREKVRINTPNIRLDQFLKWIGIAQTGGEGKKMISEGLIRVNGVLEKKRGRLLADGDEVSVEINTDQPGLGKVFIVLSGGE